MAAAENEIQIPQGFQQHPRLESNLWGHADRPPRWPAALFLVPSRSGGTRRPSAAGGSEDLCEATHPLVALWVEG